MGVATSKEPLVELLYATMAPGTNTIFFIPVSAIPKGRRATYLRIVCAHQPEKTVPHHVRWTVGGDRVEYTGNVSTKTADLITAKLLFNSVISTPGACCMIGDLKDFYLGTPMQLADYAYMRIPVAVLPPTSWPTTTSTPLSTMAMSMSKFVVVCMVSLKPARLPMTNSSSSFSHMAITHALSPLVFGNTPHVTSASP